MNIDLSALEGTEAFETSYPEAQLLEAGKYTLTVRGKEVRAKRSVNSGNVYLTVAVAATADASGEKVNSQLIYNMIPFEGTNKSGTANVLQFAKFFSALGLDPDQVRALAENVAGQIGDIGSGEEATLSLAIAGEPYSPTGTAFMGSIKQDEYNGKTKNVVSSVWAKTGE